MGIESLKYGRLFIEKLFWKSSTWLIKDRFLKYTWNNSAISTFNKEYSLFI